MNEIVFEVSQEPGGGFVAECLTESIYTQADNWEELRRNVREAVAAFHFDHPHPPAAIRLHLVRDEVFANSQGDDDGINRAGDGSRESR